ncbi:MAG: hypothetical protein ACI8YQ_001616 [Polaribacter sp.]|jgi:hypothetical protein
MIIKHPVIKLLFLALLSCTACTSSSESEAKNEETTTTPITTSTTNTPVRSSVIQIDSSGAMPTVKYTEPAVDRTGKGDAEGSPFLPELLQEVFPLDAGGLNRFSAANGSPKLLDNQKGTQSRMVYRDPSDSDRQITISITDSGTTGLIMDQIADWLKYPKSTKTDNTIERTGSLKGFPYYEYYVTETQEGEIHLLVNKRFEVVAKGRGVTYEVLVKAMETLDLKSLY